MPNGDVTRTGARRLARLILTRHGCIRQSKAAINRSRSDGLVAHYRLNDAATFAALHAMSTGDKTPSSRKMTNIGP
jgi:hypothetical protein